MWHLSSILADVYVLQDAAAITDVHMLRWQGSWDSSSSSSSSRSRPLGPKQGLGSPSGSPTAAAAAAAGGSSSAAMFSRALSGYRGAVPRGAGDAAISALEAVTGPTAATAAAAAAAAGSSDACQAGGLMDVGGGAKGLHLAELAPLSGLQPPAPRSRIVGGTECTAGEELYLRYVPLTAQDDLCSCRPNQAKSLGLHLTVTFIGILIR
jgi:hypothetical protein